MKNTESRCTLAERFFRRSDTSRLRQIIGQRLDPPGTFVHRCGTFLSLCALSVVGVPAVAFADNPTVPTNLNAAIYSDTAAELFWQPSSDSNGVAFYRVYISGVLYREASGPSIYIDTLFPGRRYDIQIAAVDTVGNESGWTSVYLLRTGAVQPAEADRPALPEVDLAQSSSAPEVADEVPTGPAVTPVVEAVDVQVSEQRPVFSPVGVPGSVSILEANDSAISIAWRPDPARDVPMGYNVYLGDSYIATTMQPRYVIRGLKAGESYRVVLTAFDDAGNFSTSSEAVLLSTRLSGGKAIDALVPTAAIPGSDGVAETASDTESELTGDQAPATQAQSSSTSDAESVSTTESRGEGDAQPLAAPIDTAQSEADAGLATDGASYSDSESNSESNSGDATEAEAELEAELEPELEPEPVDRQPILLAEGAVLASASVTDSSDFHGRKLELSSASAQPGNPPTAPENLRANLIGNNWVELNWAPSSDDGQVVAYKIYRDDGAQYQISAADVDTHKTLADYWETTTYVDCNFTHLTVCYEEKSIPEVGALHTYQVSAIDDAGNESELSNELVVQMHAESGAILEEYVDPYLDHDDRFLFDTDLSSTSNFMDEFDLIFADEFEGSELDATKWTTSLTWDQSDKNIINGEMQYFVDTQAQPDFGYDPFIFNGETLTISSIRTPEELHEKALGQPFLSGALSTHNLRSGQVDANGDYIPDKFALTYGYVEGRIRVGQESGMLTSFYLFRRWTADHSPEIDIVEYLGENPYGEEKAFQTYHYQDVSYRQILSSPTMFYPRETGHFGDAKNLDDFHTYSVLWEPGLVIWYIDGQEIQRLTGRQISRQSMNIILYLVTGSAWAPEPAADAAFPMDIEIDYVRAYKRKPWNRPDQ